MTVLRDISFLWSMVHVMVLFLLLFQPKYSKKVTLIATSLGFAAVVAANALLLTLLGSDALMDLALFTCTLPTLILFFFLSEYRDGRFFFTFCLSDTCSFWLLQLTNLLDRLCGDTYVVLFLSRILGFLALEALIWLHLRKPYLKLQAELPRGWWLFVAVGMIYYLLIFTMSVPVGTALPAPVELLKLGLIMVLMPMTYLTILGSLRRQMRLYQAAEEERSLSMQTKIMAQRVTLLQQAGEEARIQRHDLRHRLQTVAALVEQGEISEALGYIGASTAQLDELRTRRWCKNPVLDAVLSAYFGQAEQLGIRVEAKLSLPDELPVDAVELSTVAANLLENAIHACEKLPPEERRILCKCISRPGLMLEVANPYSGEVCFDADGRPVAQAQGHGVGTRSIAAFCQKHGAMVSYRAENHWFRVQLAL